MMDNFLWDFFRTVLKVKMKDVYKSQASERPRSLLFAVITSQISQVSLGFFGKILLLYLKNTIGVYIKNLMDFFHLIFFKLLMMTKHQQGDINDFHNFCHKCFLFKES